MNPNSWTITSRAPLMLAAVALAVHGVPVWAGPHKSTGTLNDYAAEFKDAQVDVAGAVNDAARPADLMSRLRSRPDDGDQILFGDLHVHSTVSWDAFVFSLPVFGGTGAHPPADACDFARYCSALDFFALTDHAETLTPRQWDENKRVLRQCSAVGRSGDTEDLIAFTGFEWTQAGTTRENHYGHRNVIFRDQDEAHLPTRAISPMPRYFDPDLPMLTKMYAREPRVSAYVAMMQELSKVPVCAENVDSKALPKNCFEVALRPQDLKRKLDQWGFEAMVIPHGTAWGLSNPPSADWARQLTPAIANDPRQQLVEVYSGHGNSEEYRPWREYLLGRDGAKVCPEPTKDYLPMCWQAGRLVRARCDSQQLPTAECERRERETRQRELDAPVGFAAAGFLAVPGATTEDWLDAGECRDCFLATWHHNPLGSVQYILSLGQDREGQEPLRFRFGMIGSSDNHNAMPGEGYKEVARWNSILLMRLTSPDAKRFFLPAPTEPRPESRPVTPDLYSSSWATWDVERTNSMSITGGLVAVHAARRTRGAIWDALKTRNVYATSGERMLLWMNLVNAPGGVRPMGSVVQMVVNPEFEAKAVGAFVQQPGCPDFQRRLLGTQRLETLCHNECLNPTERRRQITRIEVIRIHPQHRPSEPVGGLIADPWLTLNCPRNDAGCSVRFSDPDFVRTGRDTLYYVRAIQEPSPAVNGGQLRCKFDAAGRCTQVNLCSGDPDKTKTTDDCLEAIEERAWSSPIFVDVRRSVKAAADTHSAVKTVGSLREPGP
jgi:hypothetical protein